MVLQKLHGDAQTCRRGCCMKGSRRGVSATAVLSEPRAVVDFWHCTPALLSHIFRGVVPRAINKPEVNLRKDPCAHPPGDEIAFPLLELVPCGLKRAPHS